MQPKVMAEELCTITPNNKVALLCGSEDKGLANDEICYCHRVVRIPTSAEFTSLNLSYAVMVVCYEIFLVHIVSTQEFTPALASVSETTQMYAHMKDFLVKIGFLNQQNPDYRMKHIRYFFSRTKLLSKEVKIVRGTLLQMEWYADTHENKKQG